MIQNILKGGMIGFAIGVAIALSMIDSRLSLLEEKVSYLEMVK